MGFKRLLLYGGGLLLATGGPISVVTTSEFATDLRKNWSSPSAAAAAVPGGARGAPLSAHPTMVPPASIPSVNAQPAAAALPMPSIAEVLNFDVTIDWVMRRWPRVSTGLAQVQLQGYRVPLVTGTGPSDLTGALSYYFNARQQVEQITFRGVTGDAGALVTLLSSRFQFTRRMTNDPGLMLYETVDSSNRPAGTAKIRSASVINASQPYNRFDVDLTINRPQ